MSIFTCVLIIINLFLLGCAFRIGAEIADKRLKVSKLKEAIQLLLKEIDNWKYKEQECLYSFDAKQQELESIDADLKAKQLEQENIKADIDRQLELLDKSKQISSSAFNVFFDALELKYEEAERNYSEKLDTLRQNIVQDYDAFVEDLQVQMINKQTELDNLTSTVKAANEAIKKTEADEAVKAIYQLYVSDSDLSDVKQLLNLCDTFRNPRTLRMVVWQSYFQKETNNLCSRVNANNTCGIYKITNTLNNKCYIGQSKNIADRWKQHIKCGLGIDTPVTNSFYKAMMQDGVWSFTFEVLEKCATEQLNECERKWIAFFEADTIGYNGNKGVKEK